MTVVTKVYTADPTMMSEQCRNYAVRTALRYLLDGTDSATRQAQAVDLLQRSARRCSHLDTRPLDPGRVEQRYANTARKLEQDPGL